MKPTNLDKVSTFDQLAKVADLKVVLSALKSYYRSKEYHSSYNARNRELIRKAKAAGL